jgi:ubiquinone biosynthesis protein COQ9
MSAKLRENSDLLRDLRTTDRLKTAVRVRLRLQAPYAASWAQAMALGALPANLPNTLRAQAELVDEMWHLADDRSTDVSWYTKRLVLGGVYSSTELFMLTDRSPDFADTWAFLDRRLEDAARFARLPHELQNAAEATFAVARSVLAGGAAGAAGSGGSGSGGAAALSGLTGVASALANALGGVVAKNPAGGAAAGLSGAFSGLASVVSQALSTVATVSPGAAALAQPAADLLRHAAAAAAPSPASPAGDVGVGGAPTSSSSSSAPTSSTTASPST